MTIVDTKVRVINELGQDVTQDGMEQGEVIVKGFGVSNDKNKMTNDGWLRTGDIGTIDEEGSIKIMKPKQDVSSATNDPLSTVETESIFRKHPAIQEVAVITSPHIELGEILHVFIVLKEKQQISKNDLLHFANKEITDSNEQIKISLLDELPKTASGKILKTQLENMAN